MAIPSRESDNDKEEPRSYGLISIRKCNRQSQLGCASDGVKTDHETQKHKICANTEDDDDTGHTWAKDKCNVTSKKPQRKGSLTIQQLIYGIGLVCFAMCRTTTGTGTCSCDEQGSTVEFAMKPFKTFKTLENESWEITDPTLKIKGSIFIISSMSNETGIHKCTTDNFKRDDCKIVVGDDNKAHCQGLQITGNATHSYLLLSGSNMTSQYITYCIFQQCPNDYALYSVLVDNISKPDQEKPDCTGTNPWKWAFVGTFICFLLVIAYYIHVHVLKKRITRRAMAPETADHKMLQKL